MDPQLAPTKTPVFYNLNWKNHMKRELADEYCDSMYKNSLFPNLIHDGELGNENMNKLFKKYALSEGHQAIPKAYMRVVLLYNKWNETVYNFYTNPDYPQRELLKEECDFSPQLWQKMKNLITESRQWTKIKNIIKVRGYCDVTMESKTFEELMYSRAVMDQLKFHRDENDNIEIQDTEWSPQIYTQLLHFFNRNNIKPGPISLQSCEMVQNKVFGGKIPVQNLLYLIQNCGRYPPKNLFQFDTN